MSEKDILNVRTALLITLSVLVVVILWRRFRQRVLAEDMPAPPHAELLGIQLAYHPARLLVELKLPSDQVIRTRLLDSSHEPFHTWSEEPVSTGTRTLERTLPTLADGTYFLEMATATQRTVRQFRLQQA
ncbi:MAG: hypothetical protein JNM62_04755 [Flavobacteriales bacterium]|nr:hypothetical protein [Flavobacteriales bacterium]